MTEPWKIIKKPIVTEKSLAAAERRRAYTFLVDVDANKVEVERAVVALYSVEVDRVRTQRRLGKTKKTRNVSGSRPSWKKAIVTLKEGFRIDVI